MRAGTCARRASLPALVSSRRRGEDVRRNPVEIWFGVLARKVLRRGSFGSTQDLAAKVNAFLEYYNARMAHPYRLKLYRQAA